MNIQRQITLALNNPVAERFVAELNRQETLFRRKLTAALNKLDKFQRMRPSSVGYNLDFLNDGLNNQMLDTFQHRPNIVFSTDVHLTKAQKVTLGLMSGWYVYAMVYNLDDRCAGVLIKNHEEGSGVTTSERGIQSTITYQSNLKVQKWGIIYPNGLVRKSVTMPIARRGQWLQATSQDKLETDSKGNYVVIKGAKAPTRSRFLPKEATEDQLARAARNENIDAGVKAGKFTIHG